MAFVFKKTASYKWQVTVETPIDGGKFEKQTFDAVFKKMSRSAFNDLVEQGDDALIDSILEGWDGISDEDGKEIPFTVNHCLVRGLDYYTRTVFEIQPEGGSAQSTIGGGGRYDDLIEELGGKPTPAIGFAAGMERIVLNLKKQNISIPAPPPPRVFIACLGDEARNEALKLAHRLRLDGISALAATGNKSLKAQMRQANSLGVPYAVIIGEDEVKTGTVTVRHMTDARQETVPTSELPELLK